MASVDVKPKVSFFSMLVSKSSRDCVSEEVSGALPSLISLTVSVDVKQYLYVCMFSMLVSRYGLAVRRLAGNQKDLGSIRFGSPFSSLQKLWFTDTVL